MLESMWKGRDLILGGIFVAILMAACGERSSADRWTQEDIEPLRQQVQSIVQPVSGVVGVSIYHIESGVGFDIRGDERFPTASMYKVPIMVEAFRQAEEGELNLDERIPVEPDMLHFSTVLSHFDPGLRPTIRDLIFFMITNSENGATDIILSRVGPHRVTQTMTEMGLESISVDRTVKEMMEDYLGLDSAQRQLRGNAFMEMVDATPQREHYSSMWRSADAEIPEAVETFNRQMEDVASPNDLTELLAGIAEGEVVSREASREMLNIMLETVFWSRLLPAHLPRYTPVARKAGTLPTSLGETGIIYLPDGAGRVVVTVMSNHLQETRESAAGVVADIGRAAYDFFAPETSKNVELVTRSDLNEEPAGSLSGLQTRVRAIVGEYEGDVGVAVEHLESGEKFNLNGSTRYPLASVYKVPMMVELFRQVEKGQESLDRRVLVSEERWHPWGPILSPFTLGLEPTMRDLMYWMMVQSDNLATDILLEEIGMGRVNSMLDSLGLDEIRVDRPTEQLFLDYYGLTGSGWQNPSRAQLLRADSIGRELLEDRERRAHDHGPIAESIVRYNDDPQDTGSPLQVNELIIKIFRGEVVSPEASEEMIEVMLQCRTGEDRIKGLLPPNTRVAHKTGGWPTSMNDAGIIYLPGDAGHVAVTVLDNQMNETRERSANMIARISREVFDYFAARRN